MATPVTWLGPGIIKVPPPPYSGGNGQLPTAPPDTPTLNPDGSLSPPGGTGNVPPVYPGPVPGGAETPLGDVPVDGDPSTTDGASLGDVLTWSTGNPVLDAAAGGLAGYAAAPPAQRAVYAAAGAVSSGLLGVLGVLGVVGAALFFRGRR